MAPFTKLNHGRRYRSTLFLGDVDLVANLAGASFAQCPLGYLLRSTRAGLTTLIEGRLSTQRRQKTSW